MKTRSIARLGLAATLALMTLPSLAEENAETIMKAHVKALGGLEAIDKIKTIKRSGSAEMDGAFGQMSGTNEEIVVVGRKIYQKMDLGVFAETNAWDGTVGWKENSTEGVQDVEGEDLEFLQAGAEVSMLVSAWRGYGNAAILVQPEETHEGETYRVLMIAEADIKFYLDKKTNLLAGMTIPFEDPDFGEAVILVIFEDYEAHAGVQMANSVITDIGDGTIILENTYDKTKINEDVDETIFKKP